MARANSYYLERLKREAPGIHQDLLDGKIPSPAAAFKAAGLKRPRTRLQERTNAWNKATDAELVEFLGWLRARSPGKPPRPPSVASGTSPSVAIDGFLEVWARERVEVVMVRRGLRVGEVMQEMGFSPLDPSVGLALRRRSRLRPAVVSALEKWLADNDAR